MLSDKNRKLSEQELLSMANVAKMNIRKIFLHWTAGAYGQVFDDYHFCIAEDGTFDIPVGRELNALNLLLEHTWRRNSHAVGIAIEACRGASCSYSDDTGLNISWGKKAVPTPEQLDGLARAVAIICFGADIPLIPDRVMTHAEIADLDGYGVEDEDPEMKWDLLRYFGMVGNGGDIIRARAESYLQALQKGVFPWKEQA